MSSLPRACPCRARPEPENNSRHTPPFQVKWLTMEKRTAKALRHTAPTNSESTPDRNRRRRRYCPGTPSTRRVGSHCCPCADRCRMAANPNQPAPASRPRSTGTDTRTTRALVCTRCLRAHPWPCIADRGTAPADGTRRRFSQSGPIRPPRRSAGSARNGLKKPLAFSSVTT